MQALVGAKVFDGTETRTGYAVLVEGDKIVGLLPEDKVPAGTDVVTLNGGTLAPGFIDVQVNGGGGVMLNSTPTVDGVKTMVAGHRRFGTTGMMPTLTSDTPETCKTAIQACSTAINEGVNEVLGIHVEGPFFNPVRRGVHKEEYLRAPNDDDTTWKSLIPNGTLLYTLAPEMVEKDKITKMIAAGAKVSIGHTGGSYEDTREALELGADGFTHLYNAMTPSTGREPGVVGAAIEDPHSWVGVIVDKYHVHSATLKLAIEAKPTGKIMLVTDAMATIGSEDKFFMLYGERIDEKDGCLVSAEGKLAGSAISMIDAVENTVEWLGYPVEEALRMASLYPAEYLGRGHQLGRVKAGYTASLVHFDDEYKVTATWVAGERETY